MHTVEYMYIIGMRRPWWHCTNVQVDLGCWPFTFTYKGCFPVFLPHLALADGTFAFNPSLSVISNMSNLPSDKQVTSSDGIAGFQAMSSSLEPGAPFKRAFRNGAMLDVTWNNNILLSLKSYISVTKAICYTKVRVIVKWRIFFNFCRKTYFYIYVFHVDESL